MTERGAPAAPGPGRYEIRVAGQLDARWSAWFDGFALVPADDGVTVLEGPVADQAALHGVLRRLADLGLPLICVIPTGAPEPTGSPDPGNSPGHT